MMLCVFLCPFFFFFFNDTATTEIYTLSLHDALPISRRACETSATNSIARPPSVAMISVVERSSRSEEHTSELQSLRHLVCRLLLEKKKKKKEKSTTKEKHTTNRRHTHKQKNYNRTNK